MAGFPVSSFLNRPRLMAGVGVGVATAVVLHLVPNPLGPSTRGIVAWDAGVLVFVASTLILMASETQAQMRRRADRQDEGRGMILGLATAAAAISLAAIAVELSTAQHDGGWTRAGRVLLGVGTVALSWFAAQLIYALHYAHEYYGAVEGQPRATRGGLKFPGDGAPDYWDFLHFAIVIGVAAQTADVAFTSKALRRVGTLHSVFAFVFNTVVLALTVSLAANLF